MTRHMASSESSYWLAENSRDAELQQAPQAGVWPGPLAGPARGLPVLTYPSTPPPSCPAGAASTTRTPALEAVGRPFTLTARNQHLASAKRASPPLLRAAVRRCGHCVSWSADMGDLAHQWQ